jgi:hypothetical protein
MSPVESIHFERSSYREMLIEHVFAGELMRHYWLANGDLLEVAKPQVDDGGYDLILQANGVIRHVQLKSSHATSKLGSTIVALSLARKPSGCVVIIRFNVATLEIGPFHFLGGAPGTSLPDISGLKPAKNPRPNMQGVKKERVAHRCVPLKRFEPVASLGLLAVRLFGVGRDANA